MIDNRQVGRKIACMRQNRSLTQQQLAMQLNVSHQAVSKWESGQALPDIQTMLDLTRFFGITIDALLSDEEGTLENAGDESASPELEENNDTARMEVKQMNIQQLLQMAPFMSKETVEEIAMNVEERMTAAQLAKLAPYMHAETVEKLIAKHNPEMTWEQLRRIAPFMSREAVDALARDIVSGERTIHEQEDVLNKTISDIGKAFDDLGRGVGAAFDDIGKGVEQAVQKAIRFGGNVINEVSNAINDLAADAQADKRVRSERGAQLRKKAFERALQDENWDWLAQHAAEMDDDADLKAAVAEKAMAAGMNEWVCTNLSGYADECSVETAIAEGNWEWIGANLRDFSAELQAKIAVAAADAGEWAWLKEHADAMLFGEAALGLAKAAYAARELDFCAAIANCYLEAADREALIQTALEAEDFDAVEMLLETACDETVCRVAIALAEKGEWQRVGRHIARTNGDTAEALMEIALEQGNFDAIDLLDAYI